MTEAEHVPVMVDEVLGYLLDGEVGWVVDGTVGMGGHARAILSWTGPSELKVGRLIGVDRDPEALKVAGVRLAEFGERVILKQAGYEELEGVLREAEVDKADAILLDLGLSMRQLTTPERGFSLFADGPLDMRFNREEGETAGELLARLPERELADLLFTQGEEPKARRIARAVTKARAAGTRLETTGQLRRLIETATFRPSRSRIHAATRSFMALRIAVNHELERLDRFLAALPRLLKHNGRIIILSYHSLEDKIVKLYFAREAKACVCPPGLPQCGCDHQPTLRVLTKKPATPSPAEVERNPASRSARLRAARMISAAK